MAAIVKWAKKKRPKWHWFPRMKRILHHSNFLTASFYISPLQAYGRMFIGKILHKHVLARNYFSRLPGMAEHMKKISGQNRGLPNNGPRAAPLRA